MVCPNCGLQQGFDLTCKACGTKLGEEMAFKFKEGEGKKAETEVPGNEVADSESVEFEFAESKRTEAETVERESAESEAVDNDSVEHEVTESEGTETETVEREAAVSEAAAAPPKPRISIEDEIPERSSFRIPVKQILLVIVLFGSGYYLNSYRLTERAPSKSESELAPEPQEETINISDIEESTNFLEHSKTISKRAEKKERKRRRNLFTQLSPVMAKDGRINVQEVKNYRDRWVTILMKDGLQREGRITDVEEEVVHLQQNFNYGSISVTVPMQQIKKLY